MPRTLSLLAIALMCLAATRAGAAPEGPAPVQALSDILSVKQIAYIGKRRPQIDLPNAPAYQFTFKDVPGFDEVTVYYLIMSHPAGDGVVRELAAHPSAVAYTVTLDRYEDLKRHMGKDQSAEVVRQMLAAKQSGSPKCAVRIKRTLFDLGDAAYDDFMRKKNAYYEGSLGVPQFGTWPQAFRSPKGTFTFSIEHAMLLKSGIPARTTVIEGRQFFGYTFPVLNELLTDEQKQSVAADIGRVNVRHGCARIEVKDVKDLGDVGLHFLVADGQALKHPTAIESKVTLTAQQVADDPTLLNKHLAPEGAGHLLDRIRDARRTGRMFKAVEITRMDFDVVTKGEPTARADYLEFKRDVMNYCRRDMLLRAETWPDRFRRPDGTCDVEMTSARIIWLMGKED